MAPTPKAIRYAGMNRLEAQDTFRSCEVREHFDFIEVMGHADQVNARRVDHARAHIIDALMR